VSAAAGEHEVRKKTTLEFDVWYDDVVTDPQALAYAVNRLLETALSTPGILDEYGNPDVMIGFVKEE
jgi:hypothetical protein